MRRQALLAAVSLVAVTACDPPTTKQTTPPDPTTNGQQTWLCGREYANQAWGYQRRGVVLDTAGNLWRYEIKSTTAALVNPWAPRDVSNMSEEELKLRYNGATATAQKVPAEEIARYTPLIAQAANGTPTQPKSVGADMGQNLLYCYTYDAAERRYSQVMLDNKGDWDSTNPSPAARTIAAWLDSRLGSVR